MEFKGNSINKVLWKPQHPNNPSNTNIRSYIAIVVIAELGICIFIEFSICFFQWEFLAFKCFYFPENVFYGFLN